MTNEKIVCSAIKITNVNDNYNGIYLGLRHSDCFLSILKFRKALGGSDKYRIACLRNSTQGFITSKNRFVEREEAMIIAKKNKQVINKYGNGKELYSECLY